MSKSGLCRTVLKPCIRHSQDVRQTANVVPRPRWLW
jgi:hypothetical protein